LSTVGWSRSEPDWMMLPDTDSGTTIVNVTADLTLMVLARGTDASVSSARMRARAFT